MNFRIAETFQDSLTKLAAQDQKAAKLAAYDLQVNPANPGLKFHRIQAAKDPNFWSIRAGSNLRLIVHKTQSSFLLCYADHHDAAYQWAEKRKIEQHPKTGATQIVEIRERIEVIPVYRQVEMELAPEEPSQSPPTPQAPVFEGITGEQLLEYGVPGEWLADVASVTDSGLLDLLEHIPSEAAEALLELAAGGTPEVAKVEAKGIDEGFQHPDAQRRFRLITDEEELAVALEYPWEKWTVFLHPAQRALVERHFNGPAKAAGSAGTGKTIVAIHRAVFLARANPDARILLTTFSEALANLLRIKLDRLLPPDSVESKRITVSSLNEAAEGLFVETGSSLQIADSDEISACIREATKMIPDHRFSDRFLEAEWRDVLDAWQIHDWETYREVQRLGRKNRLGVQQRESIWALALAIRARLSNRGRTTWPTLYGEVQNALETGAISSPYDFVIVDEAQDLGISELRFLKALCPEPDGLFFAGDLGQRIFQQPFSWLSLGVDIRGRSQILRVNYRTSHQIREQADRFLPQVVADVDGNEESRKGAISVFSGPAPVVQEFASQAEEIDAVAGQLVAWQKDGIFPGEIGLFIRSEKEMPRARAALKAAGADWCELERTTQPQPEKVSLSTMHLAKGLEFRAVAVMACDDEVIPNQDRIESITDEAELEEAYATERHLLYVACTRARECLLLTGLEPASEFLDDFREA